MMGLGQVQRTLATMMMKGNPPKMNHGNVVKLTKHDTGESDHQRQSQGGVARIHNQQLVRLG